MENNKDIFKSIRFLFATPLYEGYYNYCLDDFDTMNLIDKTGLKELLVKIGCRDFIQTNYYIDRNYPIYFDVKTKKYRKFETPTVTKEDVEKLIKEELITENRKEKSPYEIFFGKDSRFFEKDIYSERLKEWQS